LLNSVPCTTDVAGPRQDNHGVVIKAWGVNEFTWFHYSVPPPPLFFENGKTKLVRWIATGCAAGQNPDKTGTEVELYRKDRKDRKNCKESKGQRGELGLWNSARCTPLTFYFWTLLLRKHFADKNLGLICSTLKSKYKHSTFDRKGLRIEQIEPLHSIIAPPPP
jgi:hypothetical protein